MKHRFRFFGERKAEGLWEVLPDEVFQMASVLRLKPEAAIELADGKGFACEAAIDAISKKSVEVTVEKEWFTPKTDNPIILAVGALKPKDFFDCLPQVVELGVDKVLVFGQEKVAGRRLEEKNQLKATRIMEEASKVCKRAYLPECLFFDSLLELLNEIEKKLPKENLFFGAPGAPLPLGKAHSTKSPCLLVLGGELGLSQKEVSLLKNKGFNEVSLGPHILRAKTALVASCAVLSFGCGIEDGD